MLEKKVSDLTLPLFDLKAEQQTQTRTALYLALAVLNQFRWTEHLY